QPSLAFAAMSLHMSEALEGDRMVRVSEKVRVPVLVLRAQLIYSLQHASPQPLRLIGLSPQLPVPRGTDAVEASPHSLREPITLLLHHISRDCRQMKLSGSRG